MANLDTIKKINLKPEKNTLILTLAMLVLFIYATITYGFRILLLALVSYVVAFVIEFLFHRLRKIEFDSNWIVTPLLVVLIMPPFIEPWIVGVATFFAVFFGKAIFGGSGKYIFPPALVGYIFVLISFPSNLANTFFSSDLEAGVTPLITLNRHLLFNYKFEDLLFGLTPGSIGETFRLGIIVLGVLLFLFKVIDWKTPISYILSFLVFTTIAYLIFPTTYGKDPILSLFVGSLLFGAIFIAADPVIEPKNTKGKIIYGIGLGFLTFIIRNFGTFPEGVTFAILIMSAISPLIDNATIKVDHELIKE
jgi:Na+-translocating ferredoxin:NAD+ oxidoreductase RnfD subunit